MSKKGALIPQALRKQVDAHIRDLEDRGIIRRTDSTWRNPIRIILKPNGSIRLVSNFIELNDLCEPDPFGLNNIRDVIRSTQGSEYFTVLDFKMPFIRLK